MRSYTSVCAALFVSVTLLCSPLSAQPTATESFSISQRILAMGLPYNGPNYGRAVAIQDGIMAVGAPEILASRGSVYLFKRDSQGRWLYLQTLSRSGNDAVGGKLGDELLFHQGKLLVSASRHKGSNGQIGAGKVFVYEETSPDVWEPQGELPRPANNNIQSFGRSLASDGARVIVGAPTDLEMTGTSSGNVFVYAQDAQGAWQQQQQLTSPQMSGNTRFGWALAGQDGLIAVTEPGHELGRGRAHLFKHDGQEYKPLSIISSPSPVQHGYGEKLAITQDRLFISNRPIDAAGKVYVYSHTGGAQVLLKQSLAPSTSSFVDYFGAGLAVSPQWLAASSTGSKSQVSLWKRGDDGDYKETLTIYNQTGVPTGGPLNASPNTSGFGHALVWSEGKLIVGSPFSSFSGEVFEFTPQRWVTRQQVAPTPNDEAFGQALALSRDQLIVGTPGKDSGRANTGGGYLLRRSSAAPTGWDEVTPIFSGSNPIETRAGQTVLFDRDLLVLGSPSANNRQGQVEIFRRDVNRGWEIKETIRGDAGDELGSALALHQGRLLIGAPGYKTPPQDPRRIHGRVRIYNLEQARANEVGVVALPGFSRFGEALAHDGVRLVVGAPGLADTELGAVIVYEWNGAQYSRTTQLLGQDNKGAFGRALALAGTSLVVGQPGFSTMAGGGVIPKCEGRGLAYSFDLSQPNPENTRTLIELPSNQGGTCFGHRVALNKGRAFISAPWHDEQGQLFIFKQDQGQWRLLTTLENPTHVNQSNFASDFIVADDAIFISAANQQGGALYTFELQATLTAPVADSLSPDKLVRFAGEGSPGMSVHLELIEGPNMGERLDFELESSPSWEQRLALMDGTHKAKLSFEHVSGLSVAPIEVEFSVNSTLPSPPEISSPGKYTNLANPIFEGSASAGLKVELTLKDAQQVTVATQQITASEQERWSWSSPMSFNDGVYTLEALTINSAALKSELARHEFTIDTIAPVAPSIEMIDVSNNPPKISGRAEPETTLTLELNLGEQRVMVAIDQSGRWEIDAPKMLDTAQPHRVDVSSQDEAGNVSVRVGQAFAFADVDIRDSPNNTPELNGTSESEEIVEVRITLTRDDDSGFMRIYNDKTNAQGRWIYQIEEPLAPGVYTVLVQYLGTEQFELYKLRIPYVPDDFQRSYCMTSRQATQTPASGKRAFWLIFALFGVGLVRRSARQRRTR